MTAKGASNLSPLCSHAWYLGTRLLSFLVLVCWTLNNVVLLTLVSVVGVTGDVQTVGSASIFRVRHRAAPQHHRRRHIASDNTIL